MLLLIRPSESAVWYNLSWKYRKGHVIGSATGAGTNYQIKITVYYGAGTDSVGSVYLNNKCNTDFSDIRFLASDNATLLDHWQESKTDSNNAVFWVEVQDDITTNPTNIYIYYGNSGAASASNGTNTFIVFDDFSGASLNASIWTAYNITSNSQAGGILSVSVTNHDPAKIIANVGGAGPQGNNVAIRTRFRITSGSNADQRSGLSIKTTLANGQGYCYVLHNYSTLNHHQFLDDTVAWGTDEGGAFALNTWYLEEMYHDGTNIYGRFDDGTWYSWTRSGRTGFMGLNPGGITETTATQWDFALVRKMVTTEPANGAWGAEEPSPSVKLQNARINNAKIAK
jgi:hypothetical protein